MPALVWAGFCAAVLRFTSEPLGWLRALRVLIIFACLLTRLPPLLRGSTFQTLVAWASTALPLLLSSHFEGISGHIGLSMTVVGSMLVALSCVELGRSFGISPAVRPFVQSGIYRYVRHPMYLGHIVLEAGLLIAELSAKNVLICIATWTLYSIRIRWEERLFRSSSLFVQRDGL